MAKKNWIFVKRGLSEDPKHRESMKEAIWLFLHICDAADWEKGIVYDWRDKEIAIDMSLSTNTVRGWRDRLAELGYITCIQRQHCLEIIIHNWINPRDYGGKKMNLRQDDTTMSPSFSEDEKEFEGESQGESQGLHAPIVNPTSSIESSSSSFPQERAPKKSSFKGIEASVMEDRPTTQEDLDVSKNSWSGREKMPEPIRELLDVYVALTNDRPSKGDLMDWLGTGHEWLEKGIIADDLRRAYEKSKEGAGFLVNRPGSLTRTAGMFAGERRKRTDPVIISEKPQEASVSFDPDRPFFEQFPREDKDEHPPQNDFPF